MKEINGKKYKWNDDLQQYELVELGRPKKELKMKNISDPAVKLWRTKPRAVVLKHEKHGTCFVFSSLNECAKKLGVRASDVSYAIKHGKIINNFIVEEKIDCAESAIPIENDLENMKKIIFALESGREVYRKKKSGGNWELVKCGACDFINYDYNIGCKMSDVTVSVRIDEYLKNKLDRLAKSKGISINSLLKDKLKKIIIEEFNDN